MDTSGSPQTACSSRGADSNDNNGTGMIHDIPSLTASICDTNITGLTVSLVDKHVVLS